MYGDVKHANKKVLTVQVRYLYSDYVEMLQNIAKIFQRVSPT